MIKQLLSSSKSSFNFHETKMFILATTQECFDAYCIMRMEHAPLKGPAVHLHPNGCETFIVQEGSYIFECNGETTELKAGEIISVPANMQHSYKSGPDGGKVLIIMPPHLERYFWEVSQMELNRAYSFEEESIIAESYGQVFIDNASHW